MAIPLLSAGLHESPRPLPAVAFYGIALLLAFASYAAALGSVSGWDIRVAVLDSIRNVLALAIPAALAAQVIQRFVLALPRWAAVGAHFGLAWAYALLGYWLLMIFIGLARGDGFVSFRVEPVFNSGAAAWQLLQGMTVYCAIAAIVQMRASAQPEGAEPRFLRLESERGERAAITRYFVRVGDELKPVDLDQLVVITGADDYAEIATPDGTHLVKMTLAAFERTLDPDRFIRVHRSCIVNIDRIARAEPAGAGGMLLHMENGAMVRASRGGARRLRARVI